MGGLPPANNYDAFSGLHYNHTRYFFPRTGRYLQPDLNGLEGGTNLYTYANGKPVSDTDPTGTWAEASLTRQIGGYLDSALSWFGRTPFPSYYGQSSRLAQDAFQLPGVQIALLPAMITPVGLEEAVFFVKASSHVGREIKLIDGSYRAEGSVFKFSRYNNKLGSTGRGASFLQTEDGLNLTSQKRLSRFIWWASIGRLTVRSVNSLAFKPPA